MTIDGDGALVFGTDQMATGYPGCIPFDNSADDALIAALWDDLDPEDFSKYEM